MNIIDFLIIIALIFAVIRGARLGLAILGLSLAGFFGGLFIGSLLAPHVANLSQDVLGRALLTLITTIGLAFSGSFLGEDIGRRLRRVVWHHKLEPIDGGLGAVFEVLAVLVTIWLVAAPLSNLQIGNVASLVRGSRIVRELDAKLPSAPSAISRLGSLIEPNGFPKVFVGPEPIPSLGPAPSLASLNAAISKDTPSVVKIEGRGCGGLVEGSGFVAGSGLVATNAHVVAGIRQPIIIDSAGSHHATVVMFDPDLDFAVLRADGLAGAPLSIDTKAVPVGTGGAVMGYPGGGPLTAVSAQVLDRINALGRNIYDQGDTSRQIYELQARVEPGNSGGPLIASDGNVMGVVFAKSQSNDQVGYALISPSILSELRQAANSGPVGTGACVE